MAYPSGPAQVAEVLEPSLEFPHVEGPLDRVQKRQPLGAHERGLGASRSLGAIYLAQMPKAGLSGLPIASGVIPATEAGKVGQGQLKEPQEPKEKDRASKEAVNVKELRSFHQVIR